MFKMYLATILLYFVFFLLYILRCFINRNKIKLSGNNNSWFIFIRIFIIGLMPIVNIYFFMIFVYFSILADDEEFIRLISKEC